MKHMAVCFPAFVGWAHWASKIDSPIRVAYKLKSQTPSARGLPDPQVVLLPCGLDRLVEGSRCGPLKYTFYFAFGNRVVWGPQNDDKS